MGFKPLPHEGHEPGAVHGGKEGARFQFPDPEKALCSKKGVNRQGDSWSNKRVSILLKEIYGAGRGANGLGVLRNRCRLCHKRLSV